MTTYMIGSPNGWRGSVFDAESYDAAVAIAAAPPYRETVLDGMDWQDEDGSPCVLLVVADEPAGSDLR